MTDEVSVRRLAWVAALSPVLGLLTGLASAVVLPLILFPLAAAGPLLQVLGFVAYGWLVGRYAGKYAGLAVLLGLGGLFGITVLASGIWKLEGAGFPVVVLILDLAAAAIVAEVAGRRSRAPTKSGSARPDGGGGRGDDGGR